MALKVVGLSCQRGGRTIFSDLSVDVAEGNVLIVKGPNGAGKSTLLRAIAGLLRISTGTVHLGATTIDDRAVWQESVGFAGHLDAVKSTMTVRQNLDAWAGLFATDPKRTDQAMATFGLEEIAEQRAAECSAGQRRRLGLARLIMIDRPLWLLDEPTVSLDDQACAQFASMVQDHAATGGIAIIATHIELGLQGSETLLMGEQKDTRGAKDIFLEGSWA